MPDIAYRFERCNFETEENSEGTSETEKPMPERIEIYVSENRIKFQIVNLRTNLITNRLNLFFEIFINLS